MTETFSTQAIYKGRVVTVQICGVSTIAYLASELPHTRALLKKTSAVMPCKQVVDPTKKITAAMQCKPPVGKRRQKKHKLTCEVKSGDSISTHHISKRRGNNRQSTTVIQRKRVVKSIQDKAVTYFHYRWDGDIEWIDTNKKKDEHRKVEDLFTSDYEILDCVNDTTNLIVKGEDGNLVFGKLSQRQTSELGTANDWEKIRVLFRNAIGMKDDIGRGKKRSGSNNCYKCFGHRKDPLGTGIGQYSFRQKVTAQDQESMVKEIGKLVDRMEQVGRRLTQQMPEHATYKTLKTKFDIPTVATNGKAFATQFSLGRNYWSGSHIDSDYYYTLLSCLSHNKSHHHRVLQYMVFAEYKLAVPIRSGDLLWFDPLSYHSCSNPAFPDSFIFSAYVSRKTVLTQVRSKLA